MARLKRAGARSLAFRDLTELSMEVERCDVVLMFSDGFDTHSLLACLDTIEPSGPVLVVVTEHVPPPWKPKHRHKSLVTVFVTPAIWETQGLGVVQMVRMCNRYGAASEDSVHGLPFTD